MIKKIKTNLLITLIFFGIAQQVVIADSIDFEKMFYQYYKKNVGAVIVLELKNLMRVFY